MPRRAQTPTGQDGTRRLLATRRVRLATTAAAATGVALVGVFVELAAAATHHHAQGTLPATPASPSTSSGGQGWSPYDQGGGESPYGQPYDGGGYVQAPTYQGGGGYVGGGAPVSGAS